MKNSKNRRVPMNLTFVILVFGFVLAGGYVRVPAQITFAEGATFALGESAAASIVTGDFNGDGKLDAAAANRDSNSISILLGDGAGGFAPKIDIATEAAPAAIAAGDFNGDGNLDLLTAHANEGFVRLRLGDGAGGFAAFSINGVPTPQGLTVGDFDRDGRLDAMSANGASNSVTFLRGLGNGAFTPSTIAVGAAPRSITAGDFNRDGKLDYATANTANDSVSVGLRNGNGSGFAAPVVYAVGDQPRAVFAGDFNRDGNLDLVTADSGTNANSGISVLPGNGTGGFNQVVGSDTNDVISGAAAVGDFDNDGILDLAAILRYSAFGSGGIVIYRGQGNGGFLEATKPIAPNFDYTTLAVGDFNNDGKTDLLPVFFSFAKLILNTTYPATCSTTSFSVSSGSLGPNAANPWGVTTADFDLDGKLDLATANEASDNVSVLYGTGSGAFSLQVNYAVGDFPRGITAGDFNNDGKPDLAVTNSRDQNVSILIGNGIGGVSGNFVTRGVVGVGNGPIGIKTGDFNGDGKLDLVTANSAQNSKNVSILLGNGAGDFALSGNFPVIDSAIEVAVGDFNGDGKLDIAASSRAEFTETEFISILIGNGAGGFAPAVYFSSGGDSDSLTTGDFNRDGNLDLAFSEDDGVSVLLGDGAGGFAAQAVSRRGSVIALAGQSA